MSTFNFPQNENCCHRAFDAYGDRLVGLLVDEFFVKKEWLSQIEEMLTDDDTKQKKREATELLSFIIINGNFSFEFGNVPEFGIPYLHWSHLLI